MTRDKERNEIIFQGTQDASIQVASEIRSKNEGVNAITFAGTTNTIDALLNNIGGEISLTLSGASSTTTLSKNILNDNGSNNIIFGADGATLILKGETNQITKISALNTASTGNTLKLDSTTNNVQTTLNEVTNGDKLKIDFATNNNSAELTLNSNKVSNLQSA